MAYVHLGRRYRQLTNQDLEHPETLGGMELFESQAGISWHELLENPRVVLLAEAGAGKTEELKWMANQLRAEEKFAFFVEIEALARASLRDALSLEDEPLLDAWLADGKSQAWFLLDSVDELKLTQGRFDRALQTFSKGVKGFLERVNVIVSCRPNDWRPESDLHALTKLLPRYAVQEALESPEDAFFALLERRQNAPSERRSQLQAIPFLTVVLAPLSDKQVSEFVRHLTDEPGAFIEEVDRQHAWDFARRPLDLIELVALWKQIGRLGTRAEQHKANVDARLRERPGRPDNAVLTSAEAEEGAQRLALALALTRTRSIKTPDQPLTRERAVAVLEPAEVLPDWSEAKVLALLRRGLFDPATYGRVRFHHRSIQEYLAARRLVTLRGRGMPVKALFSFLFAQTHGTKVLIPSMRPIAAWVSLWLDEVRREVIAREPEVLLKMGDPESLEIAVRREILHAFVAAYGKGGRRGIGIPIDEVRRLASRELEPYIRQLWATAKSNEDARELLLELTWKSGGADCIDLVKEAAVERAYSGYHRLLAIQTLLANSQTEALRKIADDLLSTGGGWPRRSIATVASELFPRVLKTEELLELVERTPETEGSSGGFRWQMKSICQEIPLGPEAEKLRQGLVDLIEKGSTADSSVYQPLSSRAYLSSALRQLCVRQFAASSWGNTAEFIWACIVGYRYRNSIDSSRDDELVKLFRVCSSPIRQMAFWAEVTFARKFEKPEDAWGIVFSALHGGVLGELGLADQGWLLDDLRSRTSAQERKFAVVGLVWVWRGGGKNESLLEEIRRACRRDRKLLAFVDEFTTPPRQSAQLCSYEETRAERNANRELADELRLLRWDSWRQEVLADPKRAFGGQFRRENTECMMDWLSAGYVPRSSSWDRERIAQAFSEETADLLEEAIQEYWRSSDPPLHSERPRDERNSYALSWLIGLLGLYVESRKRGWAEKLTSEEARLAVRQSTLEINGFPEWLPDLAKAQPQIVQEVLTKELHAQVDEAQDTDSIPLLQTVSHADLSIKRLLYCACREIFVEWDPAARGLQQAHYHAEQLLATLLQVAEGPEREFLARICQERLRSCRPAPISAVWLKALFALDAVAGADELETILTEGKGKEPVSILASVFGHIGRERASFAAIRDEAAVSAIGRLIRAAFRVVRPEDDEEHEGVYTPSERDHAEQARSYLLSTLVTTAGRAARDELVDLAQDPLLSEMHERLRYLARERAAADSEFDALQPADIRAMDARLEAPPTTRDALYALMMDRLDDLQHDISHHEFSDKRTLRAIEQEVEMQRTLALRLESKSRQNYSIFRESEVADAKRTDIVLAAAGSLQKAVIEIKIADDRWTLAQLKTALTDQLVRLYQRHDNCRAGCLLITNNGRRTDWNNGRIRLDWNGLLEYLCRVADEVERARRPELRVGVFGLDLRDPPLTR